MTSTQTPSTKQNSLKPNSWTASEYQVKLSQLARLWSSVSIVNGDGILLFSKDHSTQILTTTRLVAFQIIKKYLKPCVGDLIILNDPENGGFAYSRLIFVAPLNENLSLIIDEDFFGIDFKIPPTPLYERNKENSFVWSALVESNPNSALLRNFFEQIKYKIDFLLQQNELLQGLATAKNQLNWLSASRQIFDRQVASKAVGSSGCSLRLTPKESIKLQFSIEEKQNLRWLTLDFAQTTQAQSVCGASHAIESSLVHQLIEFYQMEGYFSQAVLDQIKTVLPPNSIVSKAHPKGDWNEELQSICKQMLAFNLKQMNSHARKISNPTEINFEPLFELKFNLVSNLNTYCMHFDSKQVLIHGLDDLVANHLILLERCQRIDQQIRIAFSCTQSVDEKFGIQLKTMLIKPDENFSLLINSRTAEPQNRFIQLRKSDRVEINWRLQPS